MPDIRKVRPGEPLVVPAVAYNAFIDAATDARARRNDLSGQTDQRFFQNGIVTVQNTSGAALDRLSVVGIDVPIFTPTDSLDEFASRFALKVVTPSATTHKGKFAVLAGPADVNEVTQAYVAGICPVKINIIDATHAFADASTSSDHLDSATTGAAAILWKEASTGIKWALVRLGLPAAPATAVNPAILLPAAFETEAAQTDAWSIDSPPSGNDGVKVRLQTRSAYNEVGDKTLYAFYRDCVFDSRGCLKSVSAESRVAVDTPEDC